MPRTAKTSETTTKKRSKAEQTQKKAIEDSLKGSCDKLDKSTMELTAQQKTIRKELQEELNHTISNVDVYLLDQMAVVLDRLIFIETQINENIETLFDKNLATIKNTYFGQYIKLCNELCMSPQSRAKFANTAVTQTSKNPLIELLSDD